MTRHPQPATGDPALVAAEQRLRHEVDRLRRNIDHVAIVGPTTRNPFAWARSEGASPRLVSAAASPAPVPAPRTAPVVPPFTLIGIAEKHTGAKLERFAILAWNDEPVIAPEGARVAGRFVVRRIEADAIQVIVEGDAAPPIRLALERN